MNFLTLQKMLKEISMFFKKKTLSIRIKKCKFSEPDLGDIYCRQRIRADPDQGQQQSIYDGKG